MFLLKFFFWGCNSFYWTTVTLCVGLLAMSDLGFKARVHPFLVASTPSNNGFLRLTFGATLAGLLVISLAAKAFWPRYSQITNIWWDSNPGPSMPQHNILTIQSLQLGGSYKFCSFNKHWQDVPTCCLFSRMHSRCLLTDGNTCGWSSHSLYRLPRSLCTDITAFDTAFHSFIRFTGWVSCTFSALCKIRVMLVRLTKTTPFLWTFWAESGILYVGNFSLIPVHRFNSEGGVDQRGRSHVN